MSIRRALETIAIVGVTLVCLCPSTGAARGRVRHCGALASAGTVITATPNVGCAAARHVIDTWFHRRCGARRTGCSIDGYACQAGHGRRMDANRVTCTRGGRVITGVSGP